MQWSGFQTGWGGHLNSKNIVNTWIQLGFKDGKEKRFLLETKERWLPDSDISLRKTTFNLSSEKDPPEAPQQRKDKWTKAASRSQMCPHSGDPGEGLALGKARPVVWSNMASTTPNRLASKLHKHWPTWQKGDFYLLWKQANSQSPSELSVCKTAIPAGG